MSALIECRACGKQISPNAASCPNCGEPLPKPAGAPAAAPPPEKQTATGCLAAIIIGLLLGGIGYTLVLVLFGR